MPYTTHDTMANPEKLTHDEMFKVLPLEVMKVMIQSLAPSTTDVAIMMEKELHKKVDSMVNMKHETNVRNAYEKQFPLNSTFGPPQEKFKQEKQSHSSGFTKRFYNAIASVRKRLFVEDEVMSPYTPTHDEMFEQLPLNVMISMIQSLSLPTSTPDRAIKMEKELHILLKPLAKVKYEEAVRRAYGEQFHEDIKQEKQSHGTFATSLISPTQEVVDLSADSLSSDDELQAGTSPQQHTCTQIKNKKRRRKNTAQVRKITRLKVISHKETVDYLENNENEDNDDPVTIDIGTMLAKDVGDDITVYGIAKYYMVEENVRKWFVELKKKDKYGFIKEGSTKLDDDHILTAYYYFQNLTDERKEIGYAMFGFIEFNTVFDTIELGFTCHNDGKKNMVLSSTSNYVEVNDILVSIGGENVFGIEYDRFVEILERHDERPITIRFRR
jgi:hypothetical protein